MKAFLQHVTFQIKCLFFGLGIEVEKIVDIGLNTAVSDDFLKTNNIRPGRRSGDGAWNADW